MKLFAFIILILLCTESYSQTLKEGNYYLTNQSLIIQAHNRFEIYDYRWNEGFEVPYGSGKYEFRDDSLILVFDEIDTSILTKSMTNFIQITSFNRNLKNNEHSTSILQILNAVTGFPIPGMVVETVSDTVLTNQYGEIQLKADSAYTELTIFNPNWSIATEELTFNLSQPQIIKIELTPPTYVPYRCKELRFSIKTNGENTYKLYKDFIFYSEMKIKTTP